MAKVKFAPNGKHKLESCRELLKETGIQRIDIAAREKTCPQSP